MPQLNPQDFYRSLEKNLKSVYFLHGPEIFLIEDAVKRIVEKVFGDATQKPSENLNFEVFYAGDKGADKIAESAQSLPFFAKNRLIVVKQLHLFRDKDLQVLTPLIENPYPDTVLVFTAEKQDKRLKFYKLLDKNAEVVEFKTPYEKDMPHWVQYLAKQRGLELSAASAYHLVELLGTNLLLIDSELTKLSLAGSTKPNEQEILKQVAMAREESVFELTKAIADKKSAAAMSLMRRLLQGGQNAIGILTLVTRHLRILLVLRETPVSQQKEVALKFGIPPFFLKDYQNQATRWQVEELVTALSRLQKVEKTLKSQSLSPALVLENFIVSTC